MINDDRHAAVAALVPGESTQLTLDDLLARATLLRGRRTATRFEGRDLTYAEFDATVSRTARWLQDQGLTVGERVAAYAANSDLYVVLLLACARAGMIHVPVNFGLKGDELAYILEDSEASVLVADADMLELVEQVRSGGRAASVRQVLPFEGDDSLAAVALGDGPTEPRETWPASDGERPVQILYTSGTTSAPKGAVMTHRSLIAEYLSVLTALDLTADDRPLIAMPLYHSAAMHVFCLPYLALGACVRIVRRPVIDELLALIPAERIGSLFLAPTVWVPLAQRDDLADHDLSSLTKAQYGASIMPVTVLEKLRTLLPELGFYNCFGQSELAPLCTVLRPEEHEARPASCGRPVVNVRVRVVDPLGEPVAPGEPGEIQYQSPQLFSGYWRKAEETAAAFDGPWFRSGDQVTMDADGYVQVVDRIKDVINTGGVLVAPREVEDCIYRLPQVAEVAVIGMPDDKWIEAITAVVVLKDGAELSAADVIAHVKEHLAHFKVPKRVDFVAELPRNQSGKLLKRVLRQRGASA